jgi:hypothetical protein
MPISQRHINHLSTILKNCYADRSAKDQFEANARRFIEKIGNHRIRLSLMDWRGHGVRGLLWNFDDLKPDAQKMLSRHIIGQWRHQEDTTITGVSQPFLSEDKAAAKPEITENMDLSLPQKKTTPAPHDAKAHHGKTQSPANPPPSSNSFLTAIPAPRRDWFDRFTDWVAAVLSLLA